MSTKRTKLSINLCWLGQGDNYEESLKLARDAGFDEIDFSLEPGNALQDPGNVWMGDNYVEEAKKARALAEQYGLPITQTHTPFCFKHGSHEEVVRDVIIPTTKRALEISGLLGAKWAVVHPLHYITYRGNEEKLFQMNMDFYRELIPVAAKAGVKIAIENMWQVEPKRKYICHDTCSTPEELSRYIDELDSEWIVACLDTGHAALPFGGYEAHEFVRALGKNRLHSLHVHDNNFRGDQHQFPFFGQINWEEFAKALGEIDYEGTFTYEAYGLIGGNMPKSFIPTAVKYAADIGHFICKMIDENRPK